MAWPHCSSKTYLDILQNITSIHYVDDNKIVRPNEQEVAGMPSKMRVLQRLEVEAC